MKAQEKPFWQSKTLSQMTTEEWESLCDGCGRCCLYKLKNKEKIRQQQKEYRLKNKEEIAAKQKEYYKKNVDKILKKQKKYYLKDKEKIREQKEIDT